MKTKLIKISLIIIFGILVVGVLYWYFNYRPVETAPGPSVEQEIKETKETKQADETKKAGDEGIRSIKLEKPPFIK